MNDISLSSKIILERCLKNHFEKLTKSTIKDNYDIIVDFDFCFNWDKNISKSNELFDCYFETLKKTNFRINKFIIYSSNLDIYKKIKVREPKLRIVYDYINDNLAEIIKNHPEISLNLSSIEHELNRSKVNEKNSLFYQPNAVSLINGIKIFVDEEINKIKLLNGQTVNINIDFDTDNNESNKFHSSDYSQYRFDILFEEYFNCLKESNIKINKFIIQSGEDDIHHEPFRKQLINFVIDILHEHHEIIELEIDGLDIRFFEEKLIFKELENSQNLTSFKYENSGRYGLTIRRGLERDPETSDEQHFCDFLEKCPTIKYLSVFPYGKPNQYSHTIIKIMKRNLMIYEFEYSKKYADWKRTSDQLFINTRIIIKELKNEIKNFSTITVHILERKFPFELIINIYLSLCRIYLKESECSDSTLLSMLRETDIH